MKIKDLSKKSIKLELKGYEEIVINEIEYIPFRNLVLLQDLRQIFQETILEHTILVEYKKEIEESLLKQNCYEHFENIFIKKHSFSNIELVKKEYSKYCKLGEMQTLQSFRAYFNRGGALVSPAILKIWTLGHYGDFTNLLKNNE